MPPLCCKRAQRSVYRQSYEGRRTTDGVTREDDQLLPSFKMRLRSLKGMRRHERKGVGGGRYDLGPFTKTRQSHLHDELRR